MTAKKKTQHFQTLGFHANYSLQAFLFEQREWFVHNSCKSFCIYFSLWYEPNSELIHSESQIICTIFGKLCTCHENWDYLLCMFNRMEVLLFIYRIKKIWSEMSHIYSFDSDERRYETPRTVFKLCTHLHH